TFGARTTNAYEAEIRRATERVYADRLMALAENAAMPQVRAIAEHYLERLLDGGNLKASGRMDPESAHRSLLARDIRRFLERPAEPAPRPEIPAPPPGAPIGEPVMEWLGLVAPACSMDTGR